MLNLNSKVCQGWHKENVEEGIVFRNVVAVIKPLQVWEGRLSNGRLSKGIQDVAISIKVP
jgi:hypothetical protein